MMATFTISRLLRNKITKQLQSWREEETFSPFIRADDKIISQFSLASFHSTSHL